MRLLQYNRYIPIHSVVTTSTEDALQLGSKTIFHPSMCAAYRLYLVHTFNLGHLGGVFDIGCFGSGYHVNLVHLRVWRRDAIPVHPASSRRGIISNSSGLRLSLLFISLCRFPRCGGGIAVLPFRSLRRLRGRDTGFTRETRGPSIGNANELPSLLLLLLLGNTIKAL